MDEWTMYLWDIAAWYGFTMHSELLHTLQKSLFKIHFGQSGIGKAICDRSWSNHSWEPLAASGFDVLQEENVFLIMKIYVRRARFHGHFFFVNVLIFYHVGGMMKNI